MNELDDALYEFLVELNNLLTDHIYVHNAVFNPPIRAIVLVRGMMAKMDYERQYMISDGVLGELEQLFDLLSELEELGVDKNVIKGVREYMIFFLASSSKLTEITYELHLKEINQSNMSTDEFNRLVDEYQSNEKYRVDEGKALNKIVASLGAA